LCQVSNAHRTSPIILIYKNNLSKKHFQGIH
jgi:hypothetical protein